jgi:lipopolysaccharide transport system permease protein
VLATSDLQLRYGRGGMRAVKWFLEPYAAVGVFLVLVALVFDDSSEAVGLSIACAFVPFQLISATFGNAIGAVATRGSIIVNTPFPRILIPVSALLTETAAFAASFTLLPALMIVYGVEPTTALLWLPVAIGLTAAFALSLAFPATLLGVWYPEYAPFVGSLVRAIFFLAPGLIALDEITGAISDVMPFNPLTGIFELFRHALLFGDSPPAWEIFSPLIATAVILALGITLYRREEPYMAKLIG